MTILTLYYRFKKKVKYIFTYIAVYRNFFVTIDTALAKPWYQRDEGVTNFFIFVTKKEKSTQAAPMLGTFVTAPIDGTSQGLVGLGASWRTSHQVSMWFGILFTYLVAHAVAHH